MSLKGNIAELLTRGLAGGPWRGMVEQAACALGHRDPSNRIVQSFCRHFGAQLLKLHGDDFERIAVFKSGGEMCCTNVESLGELALMYYFLGTISGQTEDERPIAAFFARMVNPGDVFLDIGANFGFYSLFVGALCGRSGQVHAFEANPLLREHLIRSIKQNRSRANIHLNSVAVGRRGNEMLRLYGPDRIGCSSLYPHEWLDPTKSVTVPVVTIDDYRRDHDLRRIDAVKIDIEGAELDAFHGMSETFEVCPPHVIVCELMPSLNTHGATPVADLKRESSADPVAVVDFLSERGYVPYYIRKDDGRLGEIVGRKALDKLTQTVLTVCFARSSVNADRPDVFATASAV